MIFGLNLVLMMTCWFIDEQDELYGLMFHNPVAVISLMILLMGIWLDHDYAYSMRMFGGIMIILMEVYEFVTWHIRLYGGSVDLSLSFQCVQVGFYLTLFLSWLLDVIPHMYENNL